MKKFQRTLSILSISLAGLCINSLLHADTLVLKDGTVLEGLVIIQTDTKLALKQGTTTRFVRVDDIQSISKAERAVESPLPTPESRNASSPITVAAALKSLDDPVANSTVEVFATVSFPDVKKPWAKLPPREERGSGFVISGKRILTCAHFVEYATEIHVSGNKGGGKFAAQVVAIDVPLDLAELRLEDDSFFDTRPALFPVNLSVKSKTVLQVYGYDSDVSNVSVFNVAVTSVDFEAYDEQESGVMNRINSELPTTTSGGPVVMGRGNVMGMAFCHSYGNQTFSYVLPAEVVNNFLSALSSGPYPGSGAVFDQTQTLENPALREYLGLDSSVHGVVITSSVSKDGKSLLDRDVLTKAGFGEVDDQGTVPYHGDLRVSFASEFQRFIGKRNDFVTADVVRAGAKMRVSIPIVRRRPMLIQDLDGAPPSYFVFGPIVFSAVTTQATSAISTAGLDALLAFRGSPLVTRGFDLPSFKGEQLVFVPAPFFPHRLAQGYGNPTFSVVKAINGTRIKNLLQLVQILRDSKDEFVTIEFYEKDAEILVFPRTDMIEATDDILNDNNIRSQGSVDAMAVWQAKGSPAP